MAYDQVGDLLQPERFDCLVPVPLHRIKRRARGYNQAAVLAGALGALTGLPVARRWLLRRDWTRSQTGLTVPERRANVTGCFQVMRPGAGEDILLVDDVITTGATASACAQVLREAGYGRIAVLTLATTRKEG
jgi:ComF family protein